MAMLRVALIGCGRLGLEVHLPLLARRAEVIALADSSDAALAAASALVPRAERCQRTSEVLALKPDAVVICTPTGLHAALALQAAAARIPFYVEKPIANNLAEARRLVGAAGEQEVPAAVGFNLRFHPFHQEARRLIEAGAIGRVIGARTVFTSDAPLPVWKEQRASGGGALLDLFSHDADTLAHLLGEPVESVCAQLASRASEDDTAWVECRFGSGAVAQSYVAFGAPPSAVVEVYGDRGHLAIDRHNGLAVRHCCGVRGAVRELAGALREFLGGLPHLRAKLFAPWHDVSYAPALESFLACVRDRRTPRPSLHDGMASLAVVLAAEESAHTGRPVAVPTQRMAIVFPADEASP